MKKTNEITTTKRELENELKKNSMGQTILFTLLVSLLIFLLAFCYISVFSSNFYFRSFDGSYLVGVVDTSTYYDTRSGQMLYITPYSSISEISKVNNDIVYYAGNSGTGSGRIKEMYFNEGYITIYRDDETKTQNISVSTIIGKVESKADFWGFIIWFIQSEYGIVILNLALIAIVVFRVVIVATTETSAKGWELKKKLRIQNAQYRKIVQMKRNYERTGLEADIFEILDGTYDNNKQALFEFSNKKDLSDAYKFLLRQVHDAYLPKLKLSNEDKNKITNCIELMCLSKDFDEDVEYMLTDLILKTSVVDFDASKFSNSCVELIEKNKNTAVLVRIFTVLYVLLKTKKTLRDDHFIDICEQLELKLAKKSDDNNTIYLLTLSNNIKNLVKI